MRETLNFFSYSQHLDKKKVSFSFITKLLNLSCHNQRIIKVFSLLLGGGHRYDVHSDDDGIRYHLSIFATVILLMMYFIMKYTSSESFSTL